MWKRNFLKPKLLNVSKSLTKNKLSMMTLYRACTVSQQTLQCTCNAFWGMTDEVIGWKICREWKRVPITGQFLCHKTHTCLLSPFHEAIPLEFVYCIWNAVALTWIPWRCVIMGSWECFSFSLTLPYYSELMSHLKVIPSKDWWMWRAMKKADF